MKIYAPVKNATGTWCSVRFQNGVGETDNPRLIEWFKRNGYTIEETASIVIDNVMDKALDTIGEPVEKTPEEMNPNELREWLKANGYGSKLKNIRNKEKLLDLIEG